MRDTLSICLLLYCATVCAQPKFGIRTALSGAYAKMGSNIDNSFIRTGLLTGGSLTFVASDIFSIPGLETGLIYTLDGHRYTIHNFFTEKSVSARLIKHNIGLIAFYKTDLFPERDSKQRKTKLYIKPGAWFDYNFKATFKFHKDPASSEIQRAKPMNWGAVLCIELLKYKSKKRKKPFQIDFRYYYGIMNLSKESRAKWYSRKFEAGISFPFNIR
ncbi:MAG: hypothetical protein IPM36_03220 [Lewinellaceae bacterium]|nr:hypothetical protein [Lewinellaceae bacterium]